MKKSFSQYLIWGFSEIKEEKIKREKKDKGEREVCVKCECVVVV